MIPPGECMYAGRKRRKPIQKQKPAGGAEKSNPSKRHRDRLNAELDHLASLLPFPPDVVSKLDKLSVLRLSVSYLRVKSFFQAVQEKCPLRPAVSAPSPGASGPHGGSAVLEGRLLLESLDGFALVVSAEGVIFYASATIADYLGFHQTDVMHQNIYDYIHVDDRQDFCRQLHWAMDPPQVVCGQPLHSETGEDAVLGRLLRAQEGATGPSEYSAFLTRCFICRVRCLLDSTSGFLTMQFQGKLKFLFGQKRKAPSGTVLSPRLSLFCVVVPVLLPAVAEMKMKGAFLRAKHRTDIPATMDTKAKATRSLCVSELHGKPNYIAGRNNGENGISVFRAQMDACRWARVPARATCLCLRGGPDLVLYPEGAAGDWGGEEHRRVPGSSSGARRRRREIHAYDCCFETPGPMRQLNWATGKHGQDGTKLKLEPSRSDPFSVHATPRGSCLPYPGTPGTVPAFRNSPGSQQSPSAYTSQPSRAFRDGDQGQVHPPTSCPFPQGSLENQFPQPGVQCLAAGGYSTEDIKLPGVPMPLEAPCNPMLSLNVPIKMESDSGSEDAADGYSVSPGQVWLGTSDVAKRQLVTFPTRMHLKTEPDSKHHLYPPHLGHGMLGAPPRPGRELAPFHPAHFVCLEHGHGPPEPEPPPCLCVRSHRPPTLGCDCRAPGTTPMIKLEPLDSPPWAAHNQGGVPRMLPRSALATLVPPKASECSFLP
ncbi:aryl-hydrocarbon receptor repressor [Phyllostomus discolor]|uniref:Aryl hydrocarbon receptor repressor n=1 Tax=Phyllostomus discolor TaxID=89673 RepID=A0A6J2MI43_9CHIR|nr:aryl hydrocarbon receptor repressor [Phyllostomus discolor]KAF6122945.1 aryl-hydrocarbon receptor repressor [Phyllostomus discolor]